ncbi:MAG: nitroreductase [Alphaproteobacteria bacterium]|nr:nitroreductase [Alphaproteobacteria bacterium]
MTPSDLAAPLFGDALPIVRSPETLAFLSRRRSASALGLTAPGPSPAELAAILRLAARSPDHGKLAPWRFVVLEGEAKSAFVAGLGEIAAARPDAEVARVKLGKITTPPITVAVLSAPRPGKIPEWEQILSAGAVCYGLVLAAQASGFGANWITDWYAYDPAALALLGARTEERVAGYVHLGTAAEPPLERARPDLDALTTVWRP